MTDSQNTLSKTEEFLALEAKYSAINYAPVPVVITRGEGVFLYDVEGRRYFDMLSAYSAVNQGHSHPKIIEALVKQANTLALTSRAFFNDKLGLFLQRICELTGMEKVLPMNSGAEGVETAIKMARRWGYRVKGIASDKAEIIVCEKNFHGRTTTIIGFSSDENTWKDFGPHTPGFVKVPFGDVAALEAAINPNTAAFLVEPIQGEAGVILPPEGYLAKVRELCDKHNVLLICDEIQTGLGRTGKMFCYQHSGIKPDVVIMGKALSGGFYPISAVASSAEIMAVFTPGSHGSTYGGNPLAAVIGTAALDVLVSEKLPERAAELGAYLVAQLKPLEELEHIKQIRGVGLLTAIEFHEKIAKSKTKALTAAGILAKDTHGDKIRFAPALIITKEEIDEAVKIITEVCSIPESA